MDFHKMKRSELQELCKKNSIRANLTNLEMVNRLSSLYKVKDKEKPMRGGQSENDCDPRNPRQKKVRFRAGNDVSEHKEDMKAAKSKMRGVENEASPTRLTRATAGASLRGQKSALSSLIVDLTDATADDDERTEVVTGKSLRNRKVDSVVVSKKNMRGRSTRSQREIDSAEVSEKEAALGDGKITKRGSQRSTWIIAKYEENRIMISKKSLRPRGVKSSDEVPGTSLSKIVLTIIRDGLKTDQKKYHKMKDRLVGVSEETTTGVKRLYQMQQNGTLLFPAIKCQRLCHQEQGL